MNDDGKTIAFVLSAGLTPLDFIGPLQVMSGLEVVEATFGMQPRHHVVVVAEDLDPVPTDTPVQVAATTTLPAPAHSFSPAPDFRTAAPRPPIGCTTAFSSVLGATYVPQRWVEDADYLTGAGIPPGLTPLCDSRPYSLATTLRAPSNSQSSTTDSRPHGGIDWRHVDRDNLGLRVEGFAHQALDDHPDLLARLVGSEPKVEVAKWRSSSWPGSVLARNGPNRQWHSSVICWDCA